MSFLISARGQLHWKPGRSAHATAHTWFRANALPDALSRALSTCPDLKHLKLVDAFFERQVELGDGLRPSQTDVLAICADNHGLAVMAVELKSLLNFPYNSTIVRSLTVRKDYDVSSATVTSKGQITLPASLRKVLEIQPGDEMVFFTTLDGRLSFRVRHNSRPALPEPVEWSGAPVGINEMQEAIIAAAVAQLGSGGQPL